MIKDNVIMEIDGVGPLVFVKSKRRSKRLHISVKASSEVRISVPFGISFNIAKDMVLSKLDWIRKHLDRIKLVEKKHDDVLVDASHLNMKQKQEKLINRAYVLAKGNGIVFNKISIRNQRTMWGSCSQKNNISLNIKLAQLPEHLMDYVILHELVHVRVKDHSKVFWQELESLLPNIDMCKRQIKDYRLALM